MNKLTDYENQCVKAAAPNPMIETTGGLGRYARPSIQERIGLAIAQHEDAAHRANIALEVRSILEQYPDLDRLLDLIDRF